MSKTYAAGALTLVLAMPDQAAIEHAEFAEDHGMSCLGTWLRDECIKFGEQLNARDVVVRVVPGVRGKQDWQGDKANVQPDALQAS